MAKDAADLWTEGPRTLLRAGADVDLAALDRNGRPGWPSSKKQARAFMARRGELLSQLQERLFAHGRTGGDRSVLLVIQGMDTAGKGGIVRHVLGMVDPQGVTLRAFGVPTEEELSHHFLWRVRNALPAPGRIGVFDRSHYEDVLVPAVEGLAPQPVIEERFAEINDFEREVTESGTTIVKVALMVSRGEQGVRLMERLHRPDKHWKFSPGDVDTRMRWDDYQRAYTEVLRRTSTDVAPWYVVPADRKWYARMAVTELLVQALVDLDLQWPTPDWDVETQRQRLAATMSEEALAEAEATAIGKRAEVAQQEAAFAAAVGRTAAPGEPPGSEDAAAPEKAKKKKGKKAKKKDKKAKG